MLGEGPRILRAATEFSGAVRPGSRDAFTLSCHPVFGSCDLAAEPVDPRREPAPMFPCGGHTRQEILAVASFIASGGHWGRVPIASQSSIVYGYFVPNARLGRRQLSCCLCWSRCHGQWRRAALVTSLSVSLTGARLIDCTR